MHPLERISNNSRKVIFISLFTLTIVLMLVMNAVGSVLTTEKAPYGIISFELAGSVQKAQEIITGWDHTAQLHASFIQGLDFLYLIIYSTAIAFACLWAGETLRKSGWPLARLGVLLAWGLWLAAALDAIENIALVKMLFGGNSSPLPEIAAVCAIIKFSLIFAGLVYAIYALVIKFTTSLYSRD